MTGFRFAEDDTRFRIFRLAKKGGGYRTIYAPDNAHTWRKLNWVKPLIRNEANRQLQQHLLTRIVHGFCRHASPVTNAKPHVPYQYTLTIDFSNWFNTVTPDHVAHSNLASCVTGFTMPDGCPQQGLCTSPFLANLGTYRLDTQICALKIRLGWFIYTRYADDLSFSSDDLEQLKALEQEVLALVTDYGYEVNPRKTHYQSSRQGRRVITGVGVDAHGVHPLRKLKRKLRAARHREKAESVRGLEEASLVKLPKKHVLKPHRKSPGAPVGSLSFCQDHNRVEFEKRRQAWQAHINAAPYLE